MREGYWLLLGVFQLNKGSSGLFFCLFSKCPEAEESKFPSGLEEGLTPLPSAQALCIYLQERVKNTPCSRVALA